MGLFDIGNMSDEQKQALQMGLFTFGTNMMQNSVGQNPSLIGSLGNALPAGLTGYQQSLNASQLQKANQESNPLKFQQQLGEINSPDVQNALLKSKLENRTKDIPTKIREFQAFYQMSPEQQQKYIELEGAGLQNQIGSSAIANYNFRSGLSPEEQQKFDATMGGIQTINLGDKVIQIDRNGNPVNNFNKTTSPDSSPALKGEQEYQKVLKKSEGENKANKERLFVNYNSNLQTLNEIKPLLEQATGSGLGNTRDVLASAIGYSTDGAKANAALTPLYQQILMNVPRFEGPQGVMDVKIYQEAAGQLANPNLSTGVKIAAWNTLYNLNQRYAPKDNIEVQPQGNAGGDMNGFKILGYE